MDDDVPEVNSGKQREGNKTSPLIVSAVRWLFVLLGVTWLIFGAWSIFRMNKVSSSVPIAVLWVITIMMLVNALLLIWIGWGIGRGNRLYFYFGLLMLAGNIFLTFTDEFGIFDLITLFINLVIFVLLILGRSKFLNNKL